MAADPSLLRLLTERLASSPFAGEADAWLAAVTAGHRLDHGDLPRWLDALARLPGEGSNAVVLADDTVAVDVDTEAAALRDALLALSPWRKGPFRFGPVTVDAEWRCEQKWRRVAPHVSDLAGRRVLDVGGGNGYYALRMAGAGAAAVLNVDPTTLFLLQFLAFARPAGIERVQMLPLTLEALPPSAPFDSVFSMGVLYHRREPLTHLHRLRERLRRGGELVLETLVVRGDQTTCLVPKNRYARMRNVWFLPSTAMLATWLERSGFAGVRVVDETPTRTAEQRSTDWMPFESLREALDPDDATRTIEGLPAPRRATVIATRAR